MTLAGESCASACSSRRAAGDSKSIPSIQVEVRVAVLSLAALAISAACPSPESIAQRQADSTLVNGAERKLGAYVEGEEIEQQWQGDVLIWSYTISAIGAYVALTTTMFIKQVRHSIWYWLLLLQAGLALGVCSVWSMHFVGMHALHLQTPGKPEVMIHYEPIFTTVSAAAAWLIVCIALHIIMSKVSKWEMDRDEERTLARMKPLEKLRAVVRQLPFVRLALASTLVAVGVVIMHYMGMLSQAGEFSMEFDAGPIVASGFVAALAASVALPIFVTPFDSMKFRLSCSLGVGLFVNSMHYTGMSSATYLYAPYRGIWGESTVSWVMEFKDVVVFTLIIDLVLMGFTGYYVELARDFVKSEESAVEEKLAFEKYKKNVKTMIKNSRTLRYPMSLIRYDTFMRLGKLQSHEFLRDNHKLIYFNTVKDVMRLKKKQNHVVFFSHEWLSNAFPDPNNRQYKDMTIALSELAKVFRVKTQSMYIFVDYSSIPQEGQDAQQLAIDSLATYVSVSSAFVIVAPQTIHSNTDTLCNFDTYSRQFWCRLEVFCTILSSLRGKEVTRGLQNQTLQEEDDEDAGEEELVEVNRGREEPSDRMREPQQQRLFVVVEDTLHPLNFFTKDGALQPDYRDLISVFDGCVVNKNQQARPDDKDAPLQSDKDRVVPSLTGAYGSMLQDMRRIRRSKTSFVHDARYKLVEEIIRLRGTIFPEEYFGSRIQAVHDRLDYGGVMSYEDDHETSTLVKKEKSEANRDDLDEIEVDAENSDGHSTPRSEEDSSIGTLTVSESGSSVRFAADQSDDGPLAGKSSQPVKCI